jgi:hypothetical protein
LDYGSVAGWRVLVTPDELTGMLLSAFPEFAEVKVSIGIPSSVDIQVQERIPVLIWKQNGETRWISQDGIAFPARGEDTQGLVSILASGNPPAGKHTITQLRPESRKTLASLIDLNKGSQVEDANSKAEKFIDPSLVDAVQQIALSAPSFDSLIYNPTYGFGWVDPKGWKVFFGFNTVDMQAKIDAYIAIVTKLEAKGINPRLISMENLYAPYYRTEQ